MTSSGAHMSRAEKFAYSEGYEIRGSDFSINHLPNEVLTIILQCCIHDYFSHHRCLNERLPAPLHVCRKWRHLTVSTPACWSNLKVNINTQSKMKYARRNVSRRDTKSKAMQDTLNCYFNWAKDHPIDLSIRFSSHFGNGVKNTMIRWISGNMPRLRSYRDAGLYSLFVPMLPAVSVDRLSELTDLEITRPAYDFKAIHTVSIPKLRVLRLQTDTALHHDFIDHLDSPNLRALYVCGDDFKLIVTALERFPILEELTIVRRIAWESLSTEHLIPHPKANHLKRIIIDGSSSGMVFLLSTCRSWFPTVRDWTILDYSLQRALLEKQSAKELVMDYVETLSILFHLHSTAKIQWNKSWDYFPRIVHLTLGSFTDQRGSKFAAFSNRTFKMEPVIEELLKSLSLKSEHSLSPRHCPELKTIEILNLDLSLDAPDLLLNILRLRSSSTLEITGLWNKDYECRLTIKWSKYSYNDEDSVSVDVRNASYSEFKCLVDGLRAKTHLACSSLSNTVES